jgi:D-alanyl-lipoteichoic acid acyltransferase DltB (MBOAT superfamily)
VPVTSLRFFAFSFVALAFYYLSPKKFQNLFLLVVSYAFYALWTWHFPIVLFIVTCITYIISLRLRSHEQPRRLLWMGIGINLLLLGYLKYFDFFLDKFQNIIDELGGLSILRGWEILLPIGLSYYILQAISYLVDVSRGQLSEIPSFSHFALYLGYFPKMVSGPIERAGRFLPQISRKRVVDNQALSRSLSLVVMGLARKMLIANPLAVLTSSGYFESPWSYGSAALLLNIIAYAFMLYNDFAGYTSIVRGVSGFFGIELSANFRQPFFSRNLMELWTRWHITLSSWLRDYIYMPLTRAFIRRNPNPRWLPALVIPPIVTLTASAAWHGLSRHILLWGLLTGILIAGERVFLAWFPDSGTTPAWRGILSWTVTMGLMLIALVPFTVNLTAVKSYWWGMVSRWGSLELDVRVVGLIVLSLGIDVLMFREQETVFTRWPRWVQAGALAFTVIGFILLSQADYRPPFVYQGF